MASIKLYAIIYVMLLVLALSKYVYFQFFDYWDAMALTLISATMKTGLIAGYYQHLRYEPRSLSVLMAMALGGVLLLAMAASYSVT